MITFDQYLEHIRYFLNAATTGPEGGALGYTLPNGATYEVTADTASVKLNTETIIKACEVLADLAGEYAKLDPIDTTPEQRHRICAGVFFIDTATGILGEAIDLGGNGPTREV